MDYLNIGILILIFIVLMTLFYFIISNFEINSSSYSSSNINELEKKIIDLNNELINIRINQMTPIPPISSESNSKEIIIETVQPDISYNKNNEMNTGTNFNSIYPTQLNQTKSPPIIYDPIANYDIAKLTDPLVDPRGRTSADQIPTPQVAAQFNFPTQGVLDRYHRVGLLIALGSNKKDGDIYRNFENNDIMWEGQIRKSRTKSKKANRYKESKTETKSYKGIDIKENFDTDYDTDFDSDIDTDYDSIEEFSSQSQKNKNKIVNVYNNYSNQNDNSILELIGKKITDNWYKYFTSITMGNKIIKVVIRNNNRRELYTGDIVFIPEIGKSYRVKIDPMDMIEYNPYMF